MEILLLLVLKQFGHLPLHLHPTILNLALDVKIASSHSYLRGEDTIAVPVLLMMSKPTSAPIKLFPLQKMEPTSHLFLPTRFPAMIQTQLVTELLRYQHIQTINMEIAVSFNEIDF